MCHLGPVRYVQLLLHGIGILLIAFAVLPCSAQQPLSLVEALEAALNHKLEIEQGRAGVLTAQSHVLQEAAIFDTRFFFSGRQRRSYYPLTDYQHNLALSAGVNAYQQNLTFSDINAQESKLFHPGFQLKSEFDLSRADDNLENIGGVNRTMLNVQFIVPLLQGRGTRATTSALSRARVELAGSLQELNGTIADALLHTAEHYFNLLAAEARLRLAQQAEGNAHRLKSNVGELISADKLPASEIHSAEASLAQQQSRSIAAQAEVIGARLELGADLGLEAIETQSITLAGEEFPATFGSIPEGRFDHASVPDASVLRSLIVRSVALRGEVTSARTRVEVTAMERDAATEAMRRRLDLAVSSGYTGLALGQGPNDFGRAVGNRIGGANVEVSLTYNFDPARSAARANLDAAQADFARARNAENAAEQRIGREVVAAVSGLALERAALNSAESARGAQAQIAVDEQERLRAGTAPLSSVLAAQDQLLDAELATLEARRRYALALLRFRYSTGTLLGVDAAHPHIDRETFYTEPKLEDLAGGGTP